MPCKPTRSDNVALALLLVSVVLVPRASALSVEPALSSNAAFDQRHAPEYSPRYATTPMGAKLGIQESSQAGVVHLPLVRRFRPAPRLNAINGKEGATRSRSRKDKRKAVALKDVHDITYNIFITLGGISVPLILDTGSSDMWTLTDPSQCNTCCEEPLPALSLYPSPSVYPSSALLRTRVGNLKAELAYGDSLTGTRADGVIAKGQAGIFGTDVGIEDQYFAAILHTNTTVRETGSSGIFGLGFPINSMLWNELYSAEFAISADPQREHSRRAYDGQDKSARSRPLPRIPGSEGSDPQESQEPDNDDGSDEQGGRGQNYDEEPVNDRPDTSSTGSEYTAARNGNTQIRPPGVLSSFAQFGPMISRLVMCSDNSCKATQQLPSPQVSVTLQRSVFGSGDASHGLFTVGGPPLVTEAGGVGEEEKLTLTWAPVRLYTPEQSGAVLPEAPGEVYPYAWEAMMGDVWFDGVKLDRSRLGAEGVGVSALIDTGNSLIRGPTDVVSAILSLISGSSDVDAEELARYPCADAHVLSFEFGGKRFDVDPRDFGSPVLDNQGDDGTIWCIPNLAPTDAPRLGSFLNSWSLGDPFLKGVHSSFYYGNITHPSRDLPRVGFASMVPTNAAELLRNEVRAYQQEHYRYRYVGHDQHRAGARSGSTTTMGTAAAETSSTSTEEALDTETLVGKNGVNRVNGAIETPNPTSMILPVPENLFGQRLRSSAGESVRIPSKYSMMMGIGAEAVVAWPTLLMSAVWIWMYFVGG